MPTINKFLTRDVQPGDEIRMYGLLVGTATQPIRQGDLLSTRNIRHAAADFHASSETAGWTPPDVSAWRQRTFLGYHRSDGQVGTRNYWLVIPLVFCENRNLGVLKQAFEEERKDSTSAQPPAIEDDELNENDLEAVNGRGGLAACTLQNSGCDIEANK